MTIRRIVQQVVDEMFDGDIPKTYELVDALVEELGWQLIETAPRDGTTILAWPVAYCPHDDRINRVRWGVNPRTGAMYWRDLLEKDDYVNEVDPPSHWMPVLSPPVRDGVANQRDSNG